MIREATFSDASAITAIYNYYVLNTTTTFELYPITRGETIKRMEKLKEIGPYLVYEEDGEIIGYAYVSRFRERQAYEHSVESSIYLKCGCGGLGRGTKLYSELLSQISLQYHTVIAEIALPNEAGIRLHQKCGFRKVAHFSEAGWKFEKWIDVGFWQRDGCA